MEILWYRTNPLTKTNDIVEALVLFTKSCLKLSSIASSATISIFPNDMDDQRLNNNDGNDANDSNGDSNKPIDSISGRKRKASNDDQQNGPKRQTSDSKLTMINLYNHNKLMDFKHRRI